MPIQFACPHCDRQLKVPDPYAGRAATCPGCQGKVTVPPLPAPEPSEPANPFAFTPRPSGPVGDNPFGFTPPPPTPTPLEEGPPPDPARAAEWDMVRSGLRYAWIGTIVLTAVPLILLVTGLVSQIVFGSNQIVGGLFTPENEAPQSGPIPGSAARLILMGGQLAMVACILIGPLFRIAGFVHCVGLPAGASGKTWAVIAVVCETIMLLSVGSYFSLAFFSHNGFDPLLFWLGLVHPLVWLGMLGLIAGVVFVLTFLQGIGLSLSSKPLLGRIKNYAIWFASSLVLAGFWVLLLVTIGSSHPGLVLLIGILYYVSIPPVLLLKYLNLLDLAWSEIGKRAAKWRPAS